MEQTGPVRWEREGAVAVVTIDSPPMNPLSRPVMDGLEHILEELAALVREDGLRAVILTGTGKAFVAGADIRELLDWSPEDSVRYNGRGQRLANSIEEFPVPVIAAVNGYALGGGLELAMACDLRIAAATAKLGLPEAKLGILPGYGGTCRLPRLVGLGRAKRMILTGLPVTATQALEMGLVEEVCEPQALPERAREAAAQIARNAPAAVRAAKALLNSCREAGVAASLEAELERARDCYATRDCREGISAFLEKRDPDFHNH